MYCFCRLSELTWVVWAYMYIATYGKHTLIRIGDQPPLHDVIAPPPNPKYVHTVKGVQALDTVICFCPSTCKYSNRAKVNFFLVVKS